MAGKRMDRKEIEEKITEIVALQFGVKVEDIQSNTSFVVDLNADSLDAVEVVMCIEDRFDITVPDEEAERMNTVSMAADFVEKVLAKKGN
jgi:acyl carrier protein